MSELLYGFVLIRFCCYRTSDHLSGISNTDRNFYPTPVTFREPSNSFISSHFPKLHRSSYYRAHTQRKLLYRNNRLLELYPCSYGKIDIEKICGSHYLQPKHLNVHSAGHDSIDDNDDDENCEEDGSLTSRCEESVSSVDLTDQSINATYSSFSWEVDHTNSSIVLPYSVDETKQHPSLRMAIKKLSAMQRRQYTFPICSMDRRQDSPKQFEITGIHYTTLVSPMGTIPRLPRSSPTAKQLAKRRSKPDKKSPVLYQMINTSGNYSSSDRTSKSPYTETSKHIFPFKNELECFHKMKQGVSSGERSNSQQRDVTLHSNCLSKSRRRVLHKYLATRLQNSGNFDRLSRQIPKPEDPVKLGIIMPSVKESLLASQETRTQ